MPSGTVKVVVPRNNQMYVERQFVWDEKGQLQVRSIMKGPNESRPVTYDRKRKQYDDMAGEERIRGTELHFLTYERDVVLTIDLEPALKAAGIPLDETVLGHIAATMSPDGQWVLLTGYLGQKEDTTVAFYGSVEVATRTVKIVRGNMRGGWGIKPTWSENKALVSGQQLLAEYDLRSNTLTPLITGQEVYAAYRGARGILYVGSQDIGIIRPDGSCGLVIQAGTDEIFGMYHRLSPTGHYLVAKRRNRGDGLYQETVDIVDLEHYGW